MSSGKKKSSSSSTYSQTQTLNPWSQNQWQQQFDRVRGLLDANPAGQAYTGDLVAGLSGREQQARSLFEQAMGSFNPVYDEADAMIRGAVYTPQQLGTGLLSDFGDVSDKYLNPYTRDVVDVAANDIRRYNDELNASARDAALQNRAYGGSRQAVAEALNNEAAMRELARTTAELNYRGWNDAMGYYASDLDRMDDRTRYANEQALAKAGWDTTRAGLLADLASGRHQLNVQDALQLNALGEVDRGIEQDRLAAAYNERLRQIDDIYRRAAVEQGLLGQIPMLTNTSGQQQSQSVSKYSPGLLGAIGQAAGIASMFVPGGEIYSGLAGLFSKNMKTVGNPVHTGGV